MMQNTLYVINPMKSRAVQKPTEAETEPNFSAIMGEMEKMAKTPTRAMAISRPMASAISLPLNHFAMAFDTVVPAISQPQPKIMKPKAANFALAGIATHQEPSHASKPVPLNASLMA